MATENLRKGSHSQTIAMAALQANGWDVAMPMTPEIYDIVAKCPLDDEWYEFQVKTLRYRPNRGGALVLPAVRGGSIPYVPTDFDYFLGVAPDNRVYLVPNEGLWEYSAVPGKLGKWTELPTEFRTSESSKQYKND